MAHLNGFGGRARDVDLAVEWFEACGLPEGMMMLRLYHMRAGRIKEAEYWGSRAAAAGIEQPWYQKAVNRAGRSDLESDWPEAHGR